MSAITVLTDAGIEAEAVGDSLKLCGLSRLTDDQKNQIIEFARSHKLAIMAALSQSGTPGECESCPAAGYWDCREYAGQGLVCFHRAYYLGRSGKPSLCSDIRNDCPRNNELPPTPSRRR